MTKEEFMGFSSAAQHDMVLETLVRVTKNLETMEKESGKPFVGTAKQRRNDIKLLTILAEAFGKNELVWNHHDEILSRGAAEESKENTKPIVGVIDGSKRTTLEEYVKEQIKEKIKESRGKYYGKEEK